MRGRSRRGVGPATFSTVKRKRAVGAGGRTSNESAGSVNGESRFCIQSHRPAGRAPWGGRLAAAGLGTQTWPVEVQPDLLTLHCRMLHGKQCTPVARGAAGSADATAARSAGRASKASAAAREKKPPPFWRGCTAGQAAPTHASWRGAMPCRNGPQCTNKVIGFRLGNSPAWFVSEDMRDGGWKWRW